MTFKDFFKYTLRGGRFRIVHRIPGRLRLHVPDLARVPDEFEKHIASARALLERLPGMQCVSVNRTTRNILFHYDTAIVSERELLEWLERLQESGLKKFGELSAAMDIHSRLSALQAHLNAMIERMRTRHAATEKN